MGLFNVIQAGHNFLEILVKKKIQSGSTLCYECESPCDYMDFAPLKQERLFYFNPLQKDIIKLRVEVGHADMRYLSHFINNLTYAFGVTKRVSSRTLIS